MSEKVYQTIMEKSNYLHAIMICCIIAIAPCFVNEYGNGGVTC